MSEIESLKEQLEVTTEALQTVYDELEYDATNWFLIRKSVKAALTAIKDKAISESEG